VRSRAVRTDAQKRSHPIQSPKNHPKNFVTMTDDPKHRKPLSRSANAERSLVVANMLISRLKGDGKAVGLNVDEVALECISKAC
jgi:hypothetical protein